MSPISSGRSHSTFSLPRLGQGFLKKKGRVRGNVTTNLTESQKFKEGENRFHHKVNGIFILPTPSITVILRLIRWEQMVNGSTNGERRDSSRWTVAQFRKELISRGVAFNLAAGKEELRRVWEEEVREGRDSYQGRSRVIVEEGSRKALRQSRFTRRPVVQVPDPPITTRTTTRNRSHSPTLLPTDSSEEEVETLSISSRWPASRFQPDSRRELGPPHRNTRVPTEKKPPTRPTPKEQVTKTNKPTTSSRRPPARSPPTITQTSRFHTTPPHETEDRLGEVVFPRIPPLKYSDSVRPSPRGTWRFLPRSVWQILLAGFVLLGLLWYRYQIYRLGYCDDHFDPRDGTYLDTFLPHCLPCPENGTCQNKKFLGCHEGLTPVTHPLDTPLLPFPPTCVNDLTRLRRVDEFTTLALELLELRLGYHQCYDPTLPPGLTREELHHELDKVKDIRIDHTAFQDLFDRTVDQLEIKSDSVQFLPHPDGNSHLIAALRPRFDRWCRMKFSFHTTFHRYYKELSLSLFGLALVLYFWYSIRQYRHDTVIAKRCVSKVIQMLMRKDHLHLTQPHLYPESAISIVHTRDHLLARRYPHLATRDRIWSHVIATLATNANVRTYQQEFRGDAHRVWEWVGETLPSLRPLPTHPGEWGFNSASPLHSQEEEEGSINSE